MTNFERQTARRAGSHGSLRTYISITIRTNNQPVAMCMGPAIAFCLKIGRYTYIFNILFVIVAIKVLKVAVILAFLFLRV